MTKINLICETYLKKFHFWGCEASVYSVIDIFLFWTPVNGVCLVTEKWNVLYVMLKNGLFMVLWLFHWTFVCLKVISLTTWIPNKISLKNLESSFSRTSSCPEVGQQFYETITKYQWLMKTYLTKQTYFLYKIKYDKVIWWYYWMPEKLNGIFSLSCKNQCFGYCHECCVSRVVVEMSSQASWEW